MFFVFCIVVAILVAWLLLMASGWLSLRWSRRNPKTRMIPRLILAVVPVLAGFFLFRFHLRFTWNNTAVNLSWPFTLPIALGIIAIVFWLRAERGQS